MKRAISHLINLKNDIKNKLLEYFQIELDLKNGLLADELLEILGFLPCKGCIKD